MFYCKLCEVVYSIIKILIKIKIKEFEELFFTNLLKKVEYKKEGN